MNSSNNNFIYYIYKFNKRWNLYNKVTSEISVELYLTKFPIFFVCAAKSLLTYFVI